ncbi:MAG: glycosyltransferase family 1 protein [Chloroflexota bacterium]
MRDLVCLSHLRWAFVFQRPQHLLSRAARDRRVFFFEEPIVHDAPAELRVVDHGGVLVATPYIPRGLDAAAITETQRHLLNGMFRRFEIDAEVLWYYTPMALEFASDCRADVTVYDCMDELSNFKNAPAALRTHEADLMQRADLVFAGGSSLYGAKRERHPRVYLFPSSVDAAHFGQAREFTTDPDDQAAIPHPRVGFFGVIDERLDLDLVRTMAEDRPDLQFVFLGPTAKIEEADLPQGRNLHWLGGKDYRDLPSYLAGWEVAIMPFAHNESTRFISPTKTPEYLAAGCPVVSTSIPDVVSGYAQSGLVRIADEPAAFLAAIDDALTDDRELRLRRTDALLRNQSWDRTWAEMDALIAEVGALNARVTQINRRATVTREATWPTHAHRPTPIRRPAVNAGEAIDTGATGA